MSLLDNIGGDLDTSQKRPGDEHIQTALLFVQKHEITLRRIEQTTHDAIGVSSNSHNIPVRMALEPFERVLPQDLLILSSYNNDVVKKMVNIIIFLCDEISQLKEIAETRFYRPLSMFGQNAPEVKNKVDFSNINIPGMKEKMMGKFLPFLQELSNFVDRCHAVAMNLVQQISSLMNTQDSLYRLIFNRTHLPSAFYSLSDLLSVLMSLDTIIKNNDILLESWSLYKMMISYIRADPPSFNTSIESIAKFERLLVSIDQSIMIGEIFKGCIEQNFEATFDDAGNSIQINVRNNQAFLTGEFLHCLKLIIENSLAVIGTNSELSERYTIMGCVGLYALYRRLLPTKLPPDAKLHRVIWGIQKTVPVVIISNSVMWTTGEFLMTYAPLDLKKLEPPIPEAYRRFYIAQFDVNLNGRVVALLAQCKAWMILAESRIQAFYRNESNPDQNLELFGNILLKGLSLAMRASYLCKSCLVLHSSMQVPLTKNNLNDIATLLECLKALEYTFVRKDKAIAESSVHIVRMHALAIFTIVQSYRQKLQAFKKLDPTQQIEMGVICALEDLLKSSDSFSTCRQSALLVLIEIVLSSSVSNEKDNNRIRGYLNKLLALANFPKDVLNTCDTSFMYNHLALLPPLVHAIYSLPTEASRLQYIFSAFEDGIKLCQMVTHSDVTPFFVNYRLNLCAGLKMCIIEPLCADIETDLRLHIHTKHLDHMQALNPKTENLKPLRPFLDLAPLRILGLIVDIKNEVTHYLDMNFYNLTTIALHDWRTYSDMRSLAAEKLGLKLMDNFLPMGSLDQGLDVLQIMRNIHVFVSRFTYNMNMQQFMEYRPEKSSKHLNTIKIQSIAASIRQHGLGVLNTTVNFTYQFLSSKFHIFSQFLFDDYIRAHLSREHRWFKKHKNEPNINNMYPYDRAFKFAKDIRKLGVNEAGKSFLDQFRILITEIGNALGYVRMVRSASMYYCSEAVKYLPEFDDIISFEENSGNGEVDGREGAKLTEETIRAGKNLDDVINTLVKNFGEGSDYFKVLVNVFQSVLLTAEHDHLKTFYMIVPALCISWIDASLLAKDSMYKSTRGVNKEMYFTDDGFAVGIAYCLAILKQSRKNESLHWIESVNLKIKADTKELKVKQEIRDKKEAEKEKSKRKGSFFSFGTKSKAKDEDEDLSAAYDEQDEVYID
eukprot:gene6379-8787_t